MLERVGKSNTPIYLLASQTYDIVKDKPYPINQGPIPTFDQERKLAEHATQQTIMKNGRVGRGDLKPGREDSNLAFAPSVFRGMQQRRGPRSRTQSPIFIRIRGIRRTGTRLVRTSLPATPARNGMFGPVDPGPSEEENDDDQRLQDCSDSHGDGGSDS